MLILILFITGLVAGTVDAIAGGGGLISLPVLLSLGLPPHLAFGTNKLQGTVGTLMAARHYYRSGWIKLEKLWVGLLFSALGGISGSLLTQAISSAVLKKIVPILLLLIFAYTLISPKLGDVEKRARIAEKWFFPAAGFLLGLYDGFFGPGTGSFWVFGLTFFLGYQLTKATGYTKIFNLNSSLMASIAFAFGGNIDYRIALVMLVGQFIGGRLGAGLAVKKGSALIRPLFLTMIFVTIASMIYRDREESFMFLHFAATHLIISGLVLVAAGVVLLRWSQKRAQSAAS